MPGIEVNSKLPHIGTTIFTVMSALAKEYNAINLSQGFPDFDCSPELQDHVVSYIKAGYNQYPPMKGVDNLLFQIADKYNALYHTQLDPNLEITVTAGAAEALYSAITAIVHRGDEVIVIDPAYDLYRPAILINGGIPVMYPMKAPDFRINWDDLTRLVTPRTRAIIINTPQNPIGRILKKEDLLALEALTERYGLYIVSDEVYEHLIFGDESHESILKYPSLYERGFAVFSFGKTYHVTGWRIGYCIAPPKLTEEFRKIHQFNVFTVPTPIQYGLADYMKDQSQFMKLPAFFEKKRDYLQNALQSGKLKPLSSEGSYFQLYDYSEVSNLSDMEFVKKLTKEIGVAAIPMSVFYDRPDPAEKLIRLCFAKKESTLQAAAEKLNRLNWIY